MSVINKMLRDLDQRQANALPEANSARRQVGPSALPITVGAVGAVAAVRSGHESVQTPNQQRQVLLWMGGALLLVAAAGWLWQSRGAAPEAVRTAPMVVTPKASEVPVDSPVVQDAPKVQAAASQSVSPAATTAQPQIPAAALAVAAPAVSAPAALAASAAVLRTEPKTDVAAKVTTPLANALSAREDPAPLGLRMDSSLVQRKFTDRTAGPERAANPKPDVSGSGASEALERAQTLWNAGSRDAAIDLLQDAVAVVERQGAGGSFPQGNAVLLPVVRELTRMQLADARHSAVWELLTRLESQLGNVPDLWAIRANAAQRLGRHQDSVHAYLVALQSRPNEQRWLLGAAVSLAALGQSTSAADMADKARAVGVVSPDVLAYLRQQGVPLKDR